MKKLVSFLSILILSTLCFGAWNKTKPADSDTWNVAAGYIRDNMAALENGFGYNFEDAKMVIDFNSAIYVTHPTYGATGDGSTDDAAAIQAALTAVKNGGTVYFPRVASSYKIASGLTLIGKNDVTIIGDGNGLTSAVSGFMLTLAGCNNCKVINLKMTSTSNAAATGCINVTEGSNNTIRDCVLTASGTNGYGIAFNYGGDLAIATTGVRHKAIRNTIIAAYRGITTRTGADAVASAGIEITDNYMTGNTAIYIESWTGGTKVNNNFIISTAGNGSLGITLGGYPYQQANGNHIEYCRSIGIETGNCKNNVEISDNILVHNAQGIICTLAGPAVSGIVMNGNTIKMRTADGAGVDLGISVFSANSVSITGCNFEGDDDAANDTGLIGIYGGLGGAKIRQLSVTGCVFKGLAVGIRGYDTYQPVISNCLFRDVYLPIWQGTVETYGVSNCGFFDFGTIYSTGADIYFDNCQFYRNSAHTHYNKAAIAFENNNNAICGLNNCVYTGATEPYSGATFVTGTSPKIIQYSPTSFKIAQIDNATGNGTEGVETIFTAAGLTLPNGTTVVGQSGTIKTIRKGVSNYECYGGTAKPTSYLWKKGDIVYNSELTTDPNIGWVCVRRTDTTVDGNEAAGQTVITVAATAGMVTGDICGVVQDGGTIKWTTCTVDSGTQITLAAPLTLQASSGNAVYTYKFVPFGALVQ